MRPKETQFSWEKKILHNRENGFIMNTQKYYITWWIVLWSNRLINFSTFFSYLKMFSMQCRKKGWAFSGHFWPPSLKSVTRILQWWNLAKLYLSQRRSKKCMNHVTHPWVLVKSAFFHRKSANFALSRNTGIDSILIHNFWFF